MSPLDTFDGHDRMRAGASKKADQPLFARVLALIDAPHMA